MAITQKRDKKKTPLKLKGIRLDKKYLEKEEKLMEALGCINSAELYRRFLTEKYQEVFGEKKDV